MSTDLGDLGFGERPEAIQARPQKKYERQAHSGAAGIASPAGEKIWETIIPQEIAWRIFTKGISVEQAGMHS